MASYLDSVPLSGIIRIRDMMYSVPNPFRLDQGDVSFDSPDSVKKAMVQAIADNRRLWTTLADLMRDPRNALPEDLRASIVSVGIAVQREMEREVPDFDFLIAINENIAAGLSGRG